MARPKEGEITKALIARHLKISISQLFKWQSRGASIDVKNIVPFLEWMLENEPEFYRREKFAITGLLKLCGVDAKANDIALNSITEQARKAKQTKQAIKEEEDEATATTESIDDTLESLQAQIKGSRDIDQARFLKMKVDALISMRKYEVECGKYTSNEDIKEQSIKLGNVIKAMLNKYENDLPVACEGLTPAEMQVKIKAFNAAILEAYSNTIKGLLK